MIERSFIELPAGRVYVLRFAAPPGAPALHFAHANGFNAETYKTILSALAGRAAIFASDLRGHGRTTLPAEPGRMNSWTLYRDDLIAVLERLGAAPYVLAGHSMGATASLLAAARRPDLVRALVLFEPVFVPSRLYYLARLMKPLGLWERRLGRQFDTRGRRQVFPSPEAAAQAYKGRGAFRTWPDWAIADFVAGGLLPQEDGSWKLACDPHWETANFRTLPPPLGGAFRRLACPVTIVHGTIASTARVQVLDQARRLIRNVTITKVEGATHFLPKEHPGLVRAALLGALGLSPAAPA